jgi:SOS-response transcriptional repressors (RecA-mediated autopeptidases)
VNRRPAHLTVREEQVLACIRRSIEEHGEGLTVREVGRLVGLRSPGSVVYHLRNLEERGALVRDGKGWRTCRLPR